MVKKAKGKHRLDKFYHLAKEQGYVYVHQRCPAVGADATIHMRGPRRTLSLALSLCCYYQVPVPCSLQAHSAQPKVPLPREQQDSPRPVCSSRQASTPIRSCFPGLVDPLHLHVAICRQMFAVHCSIPLFHDVLCCALLCFCSNAVMPASRRMASSCCEAHANEQSHHWY